MRILIASLIACGLMAATCVTATADDDGPKRGKRGEEFRAKVLEEFDADKDGKLSETERAEARKKYAGQRGEGRGKPGAEGRRPGDRRPFGEDFRKKLLEEFDANNDGKLDDDEREKARAAMKEKMEARREAMKKKFDKDGSGDLDEEERAALRKEIMKHHGHRPGAHGRPGGKRPEGAKGRSEGKRRGGDEGRGPRGKRPEKDAEEI